MKKRTKFLTFLVLSCVGLTTKVAAQMPLSGDVQSNTLSFTYYSDISIAFAPNGAYCLSWSQTTSAPYKAYKRGYSSSGVANSSNQDVVYNTPPAGGDDGSRITMSNTGDYIITYQENNNNFVTNYNYCSIYFQRYFANGTVNGSRVFVDYGMFPNIDMASDGTFNISYVSGHYYYCPQAVYVKRYLANANLLGSRLTIETQACNGVGFYTPTIRSRNSNAFDISYAVGNTGGQFLERYNSSGINVYTNMPFGENQTHQNSVLKPNGDIVVVTRNGATGITAVGRIPATGSAATSFDYLSSSTTNPYGKTSIGINNAGDHVVLFPKFVNNVYQGIYIQQYSVNDVKVGPEYPVSTVNNSMTAAWVDVSDCSFIVSWILGGNVYHKRFSLYPQTTANIIPSVTYCSGSLVTVSGSYTGVAPTSYNWEITQCDASGIPISGGYSWTSPLYTGTPGVFTFPNSNALPCNQNYKVKLTLQGVCSSIEKTVVIFVSCTPTPIISSTANPLCYGQSATLCVNYTPDKNTFIYWNTVQNTQCIVVSPTVNTPYTVEVTQGACKGTATYAVNLVQNNPDFITTPVLPSTSSPFYNVSATPIINPGTVSGLGYYWEVSEIDKISGAVIPNTTVSNPNCWWLPTNINRFYGYDYNTTYTSANNTGTAFNGAAGSCVSTTLGKFESDHKYKITYGTWTATCPWQQKTVNVYMCGGCRLANGSNGIVEESETSSVNTTLFGYFETNNYHSINEVTIYPNPNNGSFKLSMSSDNEKDIVIYDIMGKVVFEKHNSIDRTINVDITNESKGIYFVKVITNEGIVLKKIVNQ